MPDAASRCGIGPYVLCERLPHPYYVACYRARNVDSQENGAAGGRRRRRPASRGDPPAIGVARRVRETHRREPEQRTAIPGPSLRAPSPLSPITHVGAEAGRIFAAAPWIEGRTAARVDGPSRTIPAGGRAGNRPGDAGRPGRTGKEPAFATAT